MKYIFILAFIAVYCLFDNSIGFTVDSPLYTHITYMFQHAGIGHLLLNCISFLCLWVICSIFTNRWVIITASIASACLASFLSTESIPTVGASGMIYAMAGMFFCAIAIKRVTLGSSVWLLSYLFVTVAGLLIGWFNPTTNFLLHAWSLLFGFSSYMIVIIIEEISDMQEEGREE